VTLPIGLPFVASLANTMDDANSLLAQTGRRHDGLAAERLREEALDPLSNAASLTPERNAYGPPQSIRRDRHLGRPDVRGAQRAPSVRRIVRNRTPNGKGTMTATTPHRFFSAGADRHEERRFPPGSGPVPASGDDELSVGACRHRRHNLRDDPGEYLRD
jgi:hypothetical protein